VQAARPGASRQVNVLGITFKENCGDARNSRVVELVAELRELGVSVAISDPLASPDGLELTPFSELPRADCIVMAVPHDAYLEQPLAGLAATLRPGGLIVDVKSRLPRDAITAGGYRYWRI
jgi:UDP-N-acetyl-D-galactosamine dehydrogenase